MRAFLLAAVLCATMAAGAGCTGNKAVDRLAQEGAIKGVMHTVFDVPLWP